MMSNKQVTATSFGYRYTFRLRNSGNLPKSLNPEKFSNRGSALQFIRGLHLSDSHWRGLTYSVSSFNYVDWRNSNPSSGIEPYIAECLVRGDIQVFKHKISAVLKSDAAKRQFKTKVGMSYQFVLASSLLTNKPQKIERITTEASAKELIKKLELTEPQLEALVDALELSKGAGKIADTTKLNEALCEALVKDEVIVCVETPNSATKSSEYGGSEAAPNTKFDDSPHPGLHNQSWDKVKVTKDSFKPVKQVDMENLSEDEVMAVKALEQQGRSEEQVEQLLSSGDDFTQKKLKKDDKLYGFDSQSNEYGAKKQDSMYWLDEAGYQDVKAEYYKNGQWDKEGVKNHLALPCMNRADVIDVVEVTEPQTALESKVGAAKEQIAYTNKDYTTGMFSKTMAGGGQQITPNPTKVSKVNRLTGTP